MKSSVKFLLGIICLFALLQSTTQEGIVFVDKVDPVPGSGSKYTKFQHIVSQSMTTTELDAENITLTNPSGAELKIGESVHLNGTTVAIKGGSVKTIAKGSNNFTATSFQSSTDTLSINAGNSLSLSSTDPASNKVDNINLSAGSSVHLRGSTAKLTTEFETTVTTTTFSVEAPEVDIAGSNITFKASRDFFVESSAGSISFAGRDVSMQSKDVSLYSLDAVQLAAGDDVSVNSGSLLQLDGGTNLLSSLQELTFSANISPMEFVGEQVFIKGEALDFDATESVSFVTNANGNSDIEVTMLQNFNVNANNDINLGSTGLGNLLFSTKADISLNAGDAVTATSAKSIDLGSATTPSINIAATKYEVDLTTANYFANSNIFVDTPQFAATAANDNFVQCTSNFDVSTASTADFVAGGTILMTSTSEVKPFVVKSKAKAISFTAGTTLHVEGRRVQFNLADQATISAKTKFSVTTLYDDIQLLNAPVIKLVAGSSISTTLRNHLTVAAAGLVDIDVTGGDFNFQGSDIVEFISANAMSVQSSSGAFAATAQHQLLTSSQQATTFSAPTGVIKNLPATNMTIYGSAVNFKAATGHIKYTANDIKMESASIDLDTPTFTIKSTAGDAILTSDAKIVMSSKFNTTFIAQDFFTYAKHQIVATITKDISIANSGAGNHITMDAASDIEIGSTGKDLFIITTKDGTFSAEEKLEIAAVKTVSFPTSATNVVGITFSSDGAASFGSQTTTSFKGIDIKYIARDELALTAAATTLKANNGSMSITGEQSTYLRAGAAFTLTAPTLSVTSDRVGGTYHWTGATSAITASNLLRTTTSDLDLVSSFGSDVTIKSGNSIVLDVTASLSMHGPLVDFKTTNFHKMYASDKMFLDAFNDGDAAITSAQGNVELSATRRIRILSEASSTVETTDGTANKNTNLFINMVTDDGHIVGNNSITFSGDSSSVAGVSLSLSENHLGLNNIRFTSGGAVSVVTQTKDIKFATARDFLSTTARSTIIRSKQQDLLVKANAGNIGILASDGSFSAAAKSKLTVQATLDAPGTSNAEVDFTCGTDFSVLSPANGILMFAKGFINGKNGDGISLSTTSTVGAVSFIAEHSQTLLQSKVQSTFTAAHGNLAVSGAEGVDITASNDIAFTASKGHVFIHGAAGATIQAGNDLNNINDLTVTAFKGLLTTNAEDEIRFTSTGEEGRDSIDIDATFGHVRFATANSNDIRVTAAREGLLTAVGNYTHYSQGDLTVTTISQGQTYFAKIDAEVSTNNGPILITSLTGAGGEDRFTAEKAGIDITSGDELTQFAFNTLTWTATNGGFDFDAQRQVVFETLEKTSEIKLLSKDDMTFTAENAARYAIVLDAEKDIFFTATAQNSVNAVEYLNVGVEGSRPVILMNTQQFSLSSTGNMNLQSQRTIDIDTSDNLEFSAKHNITVDSEGPTQVKSQTLLIKSQQGDVKLSAVKMTTDGVGSWTGKAGDVVEITQSGTLSEHHITITAPTTTTFTSNSMKIDAIEFNSKATNVAAITAVGNMKYATNSGFGGSILFSAKSQLDFSTNSGNIDLFSNLNRGPLSIVSKNKDVTFTTTKSNSPITITGAGEVALKSTTSTYTANSKTGQALLISAVATNTNDLGDLADVNITATDSVSTTAGRKTLISAINDILIKTEVIGTGVISFVAENDIEFEAADKMRIQNQIEGKGTLTLTSNTDDVTIHVANAVGTTSEIDVIADRDLNVKAGEDVEFQDATWVVDSDSDISITSTGSKSSTNEGIRIESQKNNILEGVDGSLVATSTTAINVEAGFFTTSTNNEQIAIEADSANFVGDDIVAQFNDITLAANVQNSPIDLTARNDIILDVAKAVTITGTGEAPDLSDDGYAVKFQSSQQFKVEAATQPLLVQSATETRLGANQLSVTANGVDAEGAIQFLSTSGNRPVEMYSDGDLNFLALDATRGDITLNAGADSDIKLRSGGIVSLTADDTMNVNCAAGKDIIFETPSSSVNSLIKVFAQKDLITTALTKSFIAKSTGPSSNVVVRGAGGRTGFFAKTALTARALYGDLVLRGFGERRAILLTATDTTITMNAGGAEFSTAQSVLNALRPSISVLAPQGSTTFTANVRDISFSGKQITFTSQAAFTTRSYDHSLVSAKTINLLAQTQDITITHDVVEFAAAYPTKSAEGTVLIGRDDTTLVKTILGANTRFLIPTRDSGIPTGACTNARELAYYQNAAGARDGKLCYCNNLATGGATQANKWHCTTNAFNT